MKPEIKQDELVKEPVKAEPEKAEKTVIHLNLAPANGGYLQHAGRQYLNGARYEVDIATAADLMEMQNRGWAHEASLHSSENKGRAKGMYSNRF